MVEVQELKFCTDEIGQQRLFGSFQCPLIEMTDKITIIPSTQVIDKVCLIHDCANAACSFTPSENTTRIEREIVTTIDYSYVHNTDYKYYLLNKFYLGESMKYFDFV